LTVVSKPNKQTNKQTNKQPFYTNHRAATIFSQALTQPFRNATSLWWDTKRNLNT